MKTLQDIATAGEIKYLLENDLIRESHVTDEPAAVREISDKETEVEFSDGLVVTIYDAVEPTASWKATDHTALLNGYYGHVNQALAIEDGRKLVEIHISDADEWECAEWYIDGERIALCDGHNGVTWEPGFARTDELDELVTPYEICGLLEEAKAAATEEADENDTDVRILARPDYYAGANTPAPHVLTGREIDPEDDDQNTDEHVFDTYEDAAAWIATTEAQTYHLAHNEAGRPDYTIIK